VKDWNNIKTRDSWEIFKIMGEFVEGFETMSRIGPCVSIFGSARTKPENKYYQLAEEVAYLLTQQKFGVITGGGPGIMEAGNKGAKRGGGKSVGLNIVLPFEQEANPFIDNDKIINFDYFFVRKVMFIKYAAGCVALRKRFRTLDELFEVFCLKKKKKSGKFPVILIGKSFWTGLIDWIKEILLGEENNISPEDLDLIQIVDTAEEAVNMISDYYKNHHLTPNF